MTARDLTAHDVAAAVVDPELPVVTIAELGILRGVDVDGGRVRVTITPTYSGCPAMDTIRADIATALRVAGWAEVDVVTQLGPAWTTDWITEAGRVKLAAAGIAPPTPVTGMGAGRKSLPLLGRSPVVAPPCPRCGAEQTDEVSRFGATACTSLWRCRACAEPFPHVKAH